MKRTKMLLRIIGWTILVSGIATLCIEDDACWASIGEWIGRRKNNIA